MRILRDPQEAAGPGGHWPRPSALGSSPASSLPGGGGVLLGGPREVGLHWPHGTSPGWPGPSKVSLELPSVAFV